MNLEGIEEAFDGGERQVSAGKSPKFRISRIAEKRSLQAKVECGV